MFFPWPGQKCTTRFLPLQRGAIDFYVFKNLKDHPQLRQEDGVSLAKNDGKNNIRLDFFFEPDEVTLTLAALLDD